MPPSSVRRRTLLALAALACSALVLPGAAHGAPAAGVQPVGAAAQRQITASLEAAHAAKTVAGRLGAKDVERLRVARAKSASTVTLIIKTTNGSATSVASAVRSAGGRTRLVSDAVGYVSARVPTAAVEKVVGLSSVKAVDLDEVFVMVDPNPADVRVGAAVAVTGPSTATPDDNPYLPTRDTGSVTFKKFHPTWDGRGITIGVLDSGVDLDHPALQTTSTGDRKIVDWVTATDPAFDGDGSWLRMNTSVTATPTFDYLGATYTAPGAGDYAVSRFLENISSASDARGDINRDGDTTDSWAVLYDEVTHDVWVDVDQDRDFSDEPILRPYRERFDVGHFGVDDPATPVAESMPFVVEFSEDEGSAGDDYVNIGVVHSAHGTHVAGIAAGHGLFGGAMDGQAPGATIVSSRACVWNLGCTSAALLDGMVDLVENRGADVINMSIGGLPALNDGNNARAELYDQLIARGVQIVISAGNSGPGVNTIGDPSVATDVISAAASITRSTWLANYGSEVRAKNELFNFSSRGPREDGGFKPNVTAPGSAISSVPTWQSGQPVAEAGYSLPPGYAMLNGTSMASPQTAGATALLLSAARAKNIDATPRMLRDAIYTTAVPMANAPVTGQGNGMISVPKAWQLLRQRPSSNDYTVSAPVCSALSSLLRTPHQGTGVYNRCAVGEGGHALRVARSYDITITRTTGPDSAVRHALTLVGNDGTWSAPASVDLPLNSPVVVTVTANARAYGTHAAILQVDDPTTAAVDQRVMLTVMQAVDLSRAPSQHTLNAIVNRNLTKSVLVSVPSGTQALRVGLSGIADGSQVRWIGIHPYGLPVESTATTQCYTNFSDANACNPTARSYPSPQAGIWELEVESRRTSPFLRNTFSLTAAALGVAVSPSPDVIPTATAGVPVSRSYTVTNAGGPVTVTPTGGPLSSARISRPTIQDGASQQFQISVAPGSTELTTSIGNTADPGVDLDLTLFNCTTGSCSLAGSSAGVSSEESVRVTNPAAGIWVVLVDGYAVPSGTTQYDYQDSFVNPAFGAVTTSGTELTLSAGQSAPFGATVIANAGLAAGRVLLGTISMRAGTTTVGSGRVIVQSVG